MDKELKCTDGLVHHGPNLLSVAAPPHTNCSNCGQSLSWVTPDIFRNQELTSVLALWTSVDNCS